MRVFMLTQGSYSDYHVLALFTTRELAMKYAHALATQARETQIRYSREALALYEREGSSYDENTIKANWAVWSKFDPAQAECNAKEIRDSRRGSLERSLEQAEKPLVMEEHFDPDWYGGFQIEEEELYDMVPVVKDDD
jgi:hypothetical protein